MVKVRDQGVVRNKAVYLALGVTLLETAFPQAVVQTCIVHMIRNSLRYVSYKDRRAVVWERVVPFLDFPPEVRKVIYTTNAAVRDLVLAGEGVAVLPTSSLTS